MGNKLSRKRHVVDERYTKPQGLYQNRDIDHKKLRKLILDAKLAPCYPGSEERLSDLEECPICFLFYPSLNRSKCCMKGICTECFLQMKPPSSNRPTQCPFCKTANYAVEYRGLRTQEEKISEQAEEQKVIEAKIKMQQQELKEENERIHKKREVLYVAQVSPSQVVDSQNQQNFNAVSDGFQMTSNSSPDLNEIHPCSDISGTTANVQGSSSGPLENRPTCSSTELPMTRSQPLAARHNRDDDFDLDLEDIMVMEAIWLSIQEQGTQRFNGSATVPDADYLTRLEQMSRSVDCPEIRGSCPAVTNSRETVPNSSVTGGLACAIAALAERQAVNNDSRQNFESQQAERNSEECESMSGNELAYNREVEEQQQACTENSDDTDSEIGERGHQFHTPDNWIEVSLESGRALSPCAREGSQCSTSDCVVDHSSEVVEVGTSFSSSIRSTSEMPWVPEVAQNCDGSVEQSTLNSQSSVVPESYEEQIMLAIAISLAEAQAQS